MRFLNGIKWSWVIIALIVTCFAHVAIKTYANGGFSKTSEAEIVDGACLEALINLQTGKVSIEEQRDNVEYLSSALDSNIVTSQELGQNGNWLSILRRRVDVREALLAEGRLKVLEAKAAEPTEKLSKKELEEAENLFNIVSHQIDSQNAQEEGLHESHAGLWRMMYHVRHEGENPP